MSESIDLNAIKTRLSAGTGGYERLSVLVIFARPTEAGE
jgi:hypothetical protein